MTIDELIEKLNQAKLSGEIQGTDIVFTSQNKHGFMAPNFKIRTKDCILEKISPSDEYLSLGIHVRKRANTSSKDVE